MPFSPFRPAPRRAAGALVLVSLALAPAARAAARNHDLQPILLPSAPPASHDHAPGPLLR